MRRRDLVFAALVWGGLLAGLVWALSTQSRWMREYAKPLQAARPGQEVSGPSGPPKTSTTLVIGTISDETRASLGRGLRVPQAGSVRSVPSKVDPKPPAPIDPR